MIKQLKMSISMLRYTFGWKMNTAGAIGLLVLGGLLQMIQQRSGFLFILMSGLFVQQMLQSLSVSHMIRTSRWGKVFQTSGAAIISTISCFIIYLLDVVILTVSYGQNITVQWFIWDGVLILLFMLFIASAYKFFKISLLIFYALFFLAVVCKYAFDETGLYDSIFELSFLQAFIIGAVFVIAGGFTEYAVSCLMYKYPLSKTAQLRGLQKVM